MEKLYHFYFDEGGMMGNATYAILSKKQNPRQRMPDNHILQYYFGKLSLGAISRHLQLFNQALPSCRITQAYYKGFKVSIDQIEYDTKELLKEHGM